MSEKTEKLLMAQQELVNRQLFGYYFFSWDGATVLWERADSRFYFMSL
jgi:hypothetical protein